MEIEIRYGKMKEGEMRGSTQTIMVNFNFTIFFICPMNIRA